MQIVALPILKYNAGHYFGHLKHLSKNNFVLWSRNQA